MSSNKVITIFKSSLLFHYIPAPGSNPTFIWRTSSMKNNQIQTTPPLMVSGNAYITEDGCMQLDGKNASLDAGEFNSIGEYNGKTQKQKKL